MNISWKCLRNAAIFLVIFGVLIFWGVSACRGGEWYLDATGPYPKITVHGTEGVRGYESPCCQELRERIEAIEKTYALPIESGSTQVPRLDRLEERIEALEDLGKEVAKALELAIYHIRPSMEVVAELAIYISPAQQLRNMADAMEKRDADLEYIKGVLQRWKEYQKAREVEK